MDVEISVESVCQFIIDHGGKVKNTVLVSNFKKLLNNPQTKDAARQKFKECVNTVAVVKTENGEKYVQLKKKYRSPSTSVTSSTSELSGDGTSPHDSATPPKNIDSSTSSSHNTSYNPVDDLPYADAVKQDRSSSHASSDTVKQDRASSHSSSDTVKQDRASSHSSTPHSPPKSKNERSSSSSSHGHKSKDPSPQHHASPKKKKTHEEPVSSIPSHSQEERPVRHSKTSSHKEEHHHHHKDRRESSDTSAHTKANQESPSRKSHHKPVETTVQPQPEPQPVPEPKGKSAAVAETQRSSHVATTATDSSNFAVPPSYPMRKKKEKKENVPPSPNMDHRWSSVDRLKASIQNAPDQSSRMSRTRPQSVMQASYAGSVERARQNFQHKQKLNEDSASLALSERSLDSKGEEQDDEYDRAIPSVALDMNEKSWIIRSAQGNRVEMRKLLNIDSSLADKKDFIMSGLHWAAKKGDIDMVQMLLDQKVDVNSKSNGGYTPLHLAAMHGHEHIITLLLEYDADANTRDYSGRQPIHYLKSVSLPLQRLLFGNDGAHQNVPTKEFAAGLRPRLDSVRKAQNRLSSAISGGFSSVGGLVSKTFEDHNKHIQQESSLSRSGSIKSKMSKMKRSKKSKDSERPRISVVSVDDADSGYLSFKHASLGGLSSSSSSPNLQRSAPSTPHTPHRRNTARSSVAAYD